VPASIFVVLFVLIGAYAVAVLAASVGLRRLPSSPSGIDSETDPSAVPFVSVVIPARNEADRIAACVEHVLACDYPAERFEVIVVDDFSTDATAARVQRLQPALPDGSPDDEAQVRLVQMADVMTHNGGSKPAAVAEGVDAARGDVILTTDADCTVRPGWIQAMALRCTPETPFVAGSVRYAYDYGFFDRLQALQFTGLVAFGAGLIGLNAPAYCNSANVAMRREVIDALDGVPEGAARDEMMLQHVAYATDRDVTFATDPDAVVTTPPASSVGTYLQQQARWSSMGLHYPFVLPRIVVLVLWLSHVALFAALAGAVVLPEWREPALSALLLKMVADGVLTFPFAKRQGDDDLTRAFVPTEILTIWAVPVVGLLGSFTSVEWKGRKI